MDLKSYSSGILLFCLQMVLIVATSHHPDKSCRACKPGYFASRLCTASHDTVCRQCSKGTFTAEPNRFRNCSPCSSCQPGEFVFSECSKHRDTVCESCSANTGKVGKHFIRECLQGDDPNAGIDDSNTAAGDNSEKSGSADKLDAVESDVINVIFGEGSGGTVIDEGSVYPGIKLDGNETDSVEEEGSGETVVDLPIGGTLPPVTDEDLYTSTQDSVRNGTVVIGEGIDIADEKKETNRTYMVLAKAPPTLEPVEEEVIHKEHEHNVEHVVEDGPVDVNVALMPGNDLNEPADEVNEDKTYTGYSKDQSSNEKSDASIGVVVTVGLVAAFVFFVLGFLVSRYWSSRRERTFNVQEAERRNGKPGVECSAIEYKDPENNIKAKTNVYDEIPSTKVNGRGGETKPARGEGPIYTKPLKKDPPAGSGQPRNGEKPERPRSDIKFIDEGSGDEGESDKLLPGPVAPNGSATQPPAVENTGTNENGEPNQPDEETPMIPKNNTESS